MPLMQTAVSPNNLVASDTSPLGKGLSASETEENWLDTLALMVAHGVSVEMAAARLGKPKVRLERAMQLPAFHQKLRDLAQETSEDVGTKLIQGSLVDSTLRLIRFRDDERVSTRDRIGICKFLIETVIGRNKDGLGLIQSALAQASSLGQGDMEAGLDAEIARMVENNPVLKAKLSGSSESTTRSSPVLADGQSALPNTRISQPLVSEADCLTS